MAVRIFKLRATTWSTLCFMLALQNVIEGIDNSILELNNSHIFDVLLYQRKFLDISSNNILNVTTHLLLLETKRFD